MFPIVAVPETIRRGMAPYRSLFCRAAGFEHVNRYVTKLILSPNKTLQEIHDLHVWEDGTPPSRRAMHEAVFEAAWDAAGLMLCHRAIVASDHRGRGREVLSLDWTYAHHDRGPCIWGVQATWDHVEKRPARYQTVVTAVLANRELIDGVAVVVQQPNRQAEEVAYLQETVEFIPIKSWVTKGSGAPGSCAGHSTVPSPDRGRPLSTGGCGLSQCDTA